MPSKKMICSRVEDGRINKENFAATGHPSGTGTLSGTKTLARAAIKGYGLKIVD